MKSFSKPVSELQAVSRKIAGGNFEAHVSMRYKNEFNLYFPLTRQIHNVLESYDREAS